MEKDSVSQIPLSMNCHYPSSFEADRKLEQAKILKTIDIDHEKVNQALNHVSREKEAKFHGGSLRSCTKVHKQGIALGRSVDLAKFNGYDELIAELDQLFEFNGELKARNRNWLIVYTDDEGDMMLVGDDPWQEFCNMVRKIYIYTRDEVQRMNPGALNNNPKGNDNTSLPEGVIDAKETRNAPFVSSSSREDC
jgi:hypothetical protein